MSTNLFNPTPPSPPESQHSLPVIVTVILLFFFILGFFSIYLCRCLMDSISNIRWLRRRNNAAGDNRRHNNRTVGLDPSIISSFPTFPYSAVKDIWQEKTGLECAVCISVFTDDDILRLLTGCSHAYHQECIDLWLGSHTTCPVCRRNLDSAEKTPAEVSFMVIEIEGEEERREDHNYNNNNNSSNSSHRISFKDEEEVERRGRVAERLPRSHSTGHSLVRSVGEVDRFRLLLPENIIKGRNWTGSCGTLGEFSSDFVTQKFDVADRPAFRNGDVARV